MNLHLLILTSLVTLGSFAQAATQDPSKTEADAAVCLNCTHTGQNNDLVTDPPREKRVQMADLAAPKGVAPKPQPGGTGTGK